MFESALEAGLVSAGVDVSLLGPMPTPAIAYLTSTFKANAGIVISASHNPYQDNGIKFFSSDGEKVPSGTEVAIEAELEKPMEMVASARIGKVSKIDDAAGRYIEFCKSRVPHRVSLRGMKIVLDCAHGATYHVAPSVLAELGADLDTIGTDPDGFNINLGVGSTSPDALADKVIASAAHVGVALDGDGDRVAMVDEQGNLVDGDELLFIIAAARKSKDRLGGGVVGTVMSNFGLEEALKVRGIDFVRAAVGDRHVFSELQARRWQLGGENSGHILCLDLISTGDGLVSALQVLAIMQETGSTLGELKARMVKYPQHMINVAYRGNPGLGTSRPLMSAVKSVERKLAGRGRVLLRPSGTEPVVRVMVEGEDSAQVKRFAQDLSEVVSEELG